MKFPVKLSPSVRVDSVQYHRNGVGGDGFYQEFYTV